MMAKTITIENVPDEIYEELERRTSLAGISISEYLVRELRISVTPGRPLEELLEAHRVRVRPKISGTRRRVRAIRGK
jgi:hypothetical protein